MSDLPEDIAHRALAKALAGQTPDMVDRICIAFMDKGGEHMARIHGNDKVAEAYAVLSRQRQQRHNRTGAMRSRGR